MQSHHPNSAFIYGFGPSPSISGYADALYLYPTNGYYVASAHALS